MGDVTEAAEGAPNAMLRPSRMAVSAQSRPSGPPGGREWNSLCPGWDSNPHAPLGARGFKPLSAAGFDTRARLKG